MNFLATFQRGLAPKQNQSNFQFTTKLTSVPKSFASVRFFSSQFEEERRRRKRTTYRNNNYENDNNNHNNNNNEQDKQAKKKFVRGPFSCTAYQTASEYKLNSFDELRNFFKNENNYAIKIMGDIIHLQYERNVPRQLSDIPAVEIIDKRDNEPNSVEANTIVPFELQDDEELKVDNRRDIFYFTKEGCVVCWGTHPTEDLMWRNKIKPFEIEPSAVVIDESTKYVIGRYTGILSDRVVLDEHNTEVDTVEHKLAFSCGLVRSLRLEVVEMILEKSLLRIVDIPKQLENGKLPKSNEWTKIIGEQIKIRGSLNFYSQLLEPPEMFWERPELENFFSKMQYHLDIPHRISLLNKRLDYSQHVTEVIRSCVTDHHSHYLEQIIILLIFLEVLFYIADKSETWRDFTFEDAYNRYITGYIQPGESSEVQHNHFDNVQKQ